MRLHQAMRQLHDPMGRAVQLVQCLRQTPPELLPVQREGLGVRARAAGDVARVMMCEPASGASGGGSPGELVAAVCSALSRTDSRP